MPFRLPPELAAALGTEWADDSGKPIYPTKPVTVKKPAPVTALAKLSPASIMPGGALDMVQQAAKDSPKFAGQKRPDPAGVKWAPGAVPDPRSFEPDPIKSMISGIGTFAEGVSLMPSLPGTPIPMSVAKPVAAKTMDVANAVLTDAPWAAAFDFAKNVQPGNIPFAALQAAGAGLKAGAEGLQGRHTGFTEEMRRAGVPESELSEAKGFAAEMALDPTNATPLKLFKAGGLLLAGARKAAFADDAVKIANATARAAGAVGARALTPRVAEQFFKPGMRILDFGSGPEAMHAKAFVEKGHNVRAYDFGSNVREGVHDADALAKQHDVVYASNVLNTQSSPEMLRETVSQIHSTTAPGGRIVVNLPASPRKFAELDADLLVKTLTDQGFTDIQRVAGSKREPVLTAMRPAEAAAPASKMRVPGKRIGGDVYVHTSAADTLPDQPGLAAAQEQLPPGFTPTIIKHNPKEGSYSFIESPDWDVADEPISGRSIKVHADGRVTYREPPKDPQIYHHKWQFVGDDYQGFDTAASRARSEAWMNLPGVDKSRIGTKSFWDREVVPRIGAQAAEPGVPSTVRAMDSGSPGWTAQANSVTGTYALRGPNGEKLAGRLTGQGDLEMKTIGKGSAANSAPALAALRTFAEKHGYQGIVFSSSEGQDVTASASKMRDRLIARGEGERIAGGKFRLFTRASGDLPPSSQPTRFASTAGFMKLPVAMKVAGASTGALAGAAYDEDNRVRGAVLGAAAGLGVAHGAVKLAKLAGKGASPAAVQAGAAALADAEDGDKMVRGLITRVHDRADAIGLPDSPVGKGNSYEKVMVGQSQMGTAKHMEDEARTYTMIADRVGITDPVGRNMQMHILDGGGNYYDARRMVTVDGVPRSRTWAQSENDASKLIWDEVPKRGMSVNAEQMISLERKLRGANEYAVDIAEDFETAKNMLSGGQVQQAEQILGHYRVGSLRALEMLADQAFEEAKLVTQSLMGVRSEAGRTLNILKKKINYRMTDPTDDDYIRVASELGANGKEIRVALTSLSTPEQKYKWLRSMGRPDANQMFQFYFITSLLSGTKTHARNTISNMINVAAMDVAHMPGRMIDVARGKLGYGPKMTLREAHKEGMALLHGQKVGIVRGWHEALNVWKNGFSAEDARILAEKPPEVRMSDIFNTTRFDGERATRYMNSVSRFLSASDQFVRTIVMSGALHAEAYTEAEKLFKLGKIQDKAKYIDEFIRDPYIINEKAWKRATDVAKDSVYQQDPSKLMSLVIQLPKQIDQVMTKGVGGAINYAIPAGKLNTAAHIVTAPVQNLGTMIAPFVKTPANVFKKQFRWMGGGLATAGAGQDLNSALRRGEALLGVGMMAGLGWMINSEGRPMITGNGPNSAGLKDNPAAALDAFYASNKPNSIRMPGTDTWVDYRSLGPLAGPLSLMGNLSDAYHQSGKKLDATALSSMVGRQARSLLTTSFLSGLLGVASMFEDRTGVSANRTAGRMGASLVPLSGALRTARQAVDPNIRDTKGESIPDAFVNNVKNIVPGLSTQLPARVDYAGQELTNSGSALGRMISPLEITNRPEDPIRARLAEIGPEAYLTKPPKELKDWLNNPMKLDNIQSAELQKAVGVAQYEAAKQLMAIPGFREMPADQRASLLRSHMGKMRDLAKTKFRQRLTSANTSTQ
jgi:hypothetical protein